MIGGSAKPVVKEFLPDNRAAPTKTLTKKKFKYVSHLVNSRRRQTERVHRVLRHVLLIAQCIGIFPISGIRGPDYSHLRYSRYGIKTIISLIIITGSSCLGLPTLLLIWCEGVTSRVAVTEIGLVTIHGSFRRNIHPNDYPSTDHHCWESGQIVSWEDETGDIMFYSSSWLSMIVFYQLAGRWRSLMESWAAVEDAMLGLPPVSVSRRISVLTVYVLCASLGEHAMAVLYNRNPCHVTWEQYYVESFRQIFKLTDFALWKGLIASFFNFLMALTWNFTDSFLMALSIALGARFQQFNLELESVIHRDMDETYWTKIREIYNKLALLTKLVDGNVSLLILISFTNNLYFICLQLLHSIEPVGSTPKMIYTIISFSHLLFRACSVCLTAADVYDKSKAPISTLFSVPSSSYNVEVQRMTLQVAFENLALTGCCFFSVTRTLMLTVAGTIATYEIVLLQFNKMSPDNTIRELNCTEYNLRIAK